MADDDKGVMIEIDPSKLSMDGLMMLGEIRALTRWAIMFDGYVERSENVTERVTLAEVSRTLMSDAENLKVQLADEASVTGAVRKLPDETIANQTIILPK
jgi:hypothetical protein